MKRQLLVLLGAVTMLLSVAVVPAQAAPPERGEFPIFSLFLDTENDLAGFWNITRDDFCAWAAGGFAGPEPVQQLIPASFHETGQGALVAKYAATAPLELWSIDDPDNPENPCVDTDGQAGPWATGTLHVTANDNDLDVSGTRRNSFGERGRGTVTDANGGSWHYSWNFRFQCQVDCEVDFVVRSENFTLQKKGK